MFETSLTPERRALAVRLLLPWRPTLHYWMETEVHVYAFSIAANILLSFFPFLIVMVGLCDSFGWRGAKGAIFIALRDYFPDELGNFITRNLKDFMEKMGHLPIFSVFLLFFTANGVFEPLEVALNRAWEPPRIAASSRTRSSAWDSSSCAVLSLCSPHC